MRQHDSLTFNSLTLLVGSKRFHYLYDWKTYVIVIICKLAAFLQHCQNMTKSTSDKVFEKEHLSVLYQCFRGPARRDATHSETVLGVWRQSEHNLGTCA